MIDPITLTIGSHINVSGERVMVWRIANTSLVTYIKPDGYWSSCDPAEVWIKPIPITEELLTELGFEKTVERGSVSVWEKYPMKLQFIGERIELLIGDRLGVSPIKYLHELEAFVYLTTKTELIK